MCAHPIALIGARALIGFGSGGGFVVCPLYVKEISEDSIRGMTGTFVIFSQVSSLSVFLSQFIYITSCTNVPLLNAVGI